MENVVYDDEPPPEPRDGWLLVRIHVPELNVYKCLQFPSDKIVWDVKQQCLASLPKELKESFNYGLFCPPLNGKAGKFLDEERRLGDYPFNGPVGYLELKYKRRVYKMLNLDERQLKALHTRANLRRFLECINGGHVEKVSKMCAKGLDPNFHCSESGETPLTIATATKKPNKLLIALVNGGALLDYRTKDGVTALHRAVERDSLEAVSTLLELGASPNYRDTKNLTPVYLSVTKKTDPKICELLLHDHATLGVQDTQGWQEVHQACRNGLVHHLEHLLFYGADMDGHNASGNTPLHVCAVNNQEACTRMLLFRGAQRGALNYANQTPYQVAVIAGNLELAEMIQNYKSEDIVPFRGPPRYNPRRRSGLGWGATLSRIGGPPSPCPSEHPFSSASSSLSEGSSSQRSHEDDISIVTDKSLGDTSDIISDSSGVGTNSDSAACSIGHPSTTVVCMELYTSNVAGHLNIQPGDVIEVVGSTDCGLLEGYVRGTNRTGFFPIECVQEVHFRQKNITNVSTSNLGQYRETMQQQLQIQQQQQGQQLQQLDEQQQKLQQHYQTQQQMPHGQYSSATAPRMKKISYSEPRSVVLHRAKRGFGFILRGAKASSPLMQLKPSNRCPALQYLDDVDPGGVADMAGLKPGDFLISINGVDVTCASHENVVDLIRSSGSLVSMTVLTLPNLDHIESNGTSGVQMHNSMTPARQCATLPRRIHGPSKLPAPAPPRRDPRTTLSVGRARAKSMVAGLEGGNGDHEDDDDLSNPTKSNSAESLHQQSQSAISTPTQGGPGTPVQPRTASIKARPTSSRITAAELEELFQRQQGADASRCSTMMTTSRFQSGLESGAATPPTSPQKGPLVYASVADMKRKKSRNGTLKGRAIPIPTVTSDLRRNFHSTPDLATNLTGSSNSGTWNSAIFKNHRSQDDVNYLYNSMQRLNLPPPTHPPPPPPVGQVVKVEVSRSEYESTLTLQKKILMQKKANAAQAAQAQESEVMSSFRPAANAKLYASPQEIRNVGYRAPAQQESPGQPPPQQQQQQQQSPQVGKNQVRKSSSVRSNNSSSTLTNTPPMQHNLNPYAQPGRPGLTMSHQQRYGNKADVALMNAPPIPDPDYSLSESDGEGDNSVRLMKGSNISVIEVNGGVGSTINNGNTTNGNSMVNGPPNPGMAIETSGNSNASGSSSGSSSIPHSFSVDEIQKIRTKLKSSKSYPNDFLRQQQQLLLQNRHPGDINEEGDNSSSGVSSDQEIPPATNHNSNNGGSNGNNGQEVHNTLKSGSVANNGDVVVKPNTLDIQKTQTLTKKVKLITTASDSLEQRSDNDDNSPSPPAKGFQRHNSLTRKQAAALAVNRAKMAPIQTRHAVTLAKLPPPLEASDESDSTYLPPPMDYNGRGRDMGIVTTTSTSKMLKCSTAIPPPMMMPSDNVVLAPPPEFCDIVDTTNARVRIVGAVPKPKTKTCTHHHRLQSQNL